MKHQIIDGGERIDVGIPGVYTFPNYGGAITQFALFSVVKSFGLSVLMIERPESAQIKPDLNQLLFRKCPYRNDEMSKLYPNLRSMEELNDICKMFLIGSDQLFNNYLYNAFGRFITLDWVRNYKKKIGYACSFGFDYIFGPEFDRAEIQRCLMKFDFFSVREKSGIKLLKNEFDLDSKCDLDPVFLCDKSIYDAIIKNGRKIEFDTPYLFAYILDMDEKRIEIIKEISEILNLDVKIVYDAEKTDSNNIQIAEIASFEVLSDVMVEEWLELIKKSSFVITDSFHGVTMSLIMEKEFLVIPNSIRGVTRFYSILNTLEIPNRIIENNSLETIRNTIKEKIDYEKTEKILEIEKKRSISRLESAIFDMHKKKPLLDYDLVNIRSNYIEDSLHMRIDELEKKLLKLQDELNSFKQ